MIKIPKTLFIHEVNDLNVAGYSSNGIVVFSSIAKARDCFKSDIEFVKLPGDELMKHLKSLAANDENKLKTVVFNLKEGCKYDAVYELEELIELLESNSFSKASNDRYSKEKFRGLLDLYDFQKDLTGVLDKHVNTDFDQAIINEIVLWKVNRYVPTASETNWLALLNEFKDDKTVDQDKLGNFLRCVLDDEVRGIRLAMASTFLRFRNPEVYQIIDERTFRVVMRSKDSKEMLGDIKNIDKQIELYIEYLAKLRALCNKKGIDFKDSDRVLYQFDIIKNGDFNQSKKA